MGVEKQGSKSGGYAGGFFQLFDWNAKSRKKLFSNKSDLPGKLYYMHIDKKNQGSKSYSSVLYLVCVYDMFGMYA